MTFYEAALLILEKEGKPLDFKFITEKAVADKLLSHVGKDPEVTMYSRLAAMAKRKGDRKVVATQPGTFGLLDWGIVEDPAALEVQVLPVPDETEPPYRPRERHPIPSKDNVRLSGRGERRGRTEEREKRRGRVPPLPELAFELLSQSTSPLAAVDLAATLREGEKVSEDLGADALLQALRDDNRRRSSQDRRPLFLISESGEISLDRAGTPGQGIPVDLHAAFAQALGVPLEGAPSVEARRGERGEPRLGPGVQKILQQVREHQKNIGRVLRRRFGELDVGALELVALSLLEVHGFRDARASKRSKDGPVITARRREGLLDVRYTLRFVKGAREVTKQDVSDSRKDVSVYNTHVGVLVASGEVARDARTEAQGGGALLLLWCGEGLAEKLVEKRVGATLTTLEISDVDEAFFKRAKEQGELDDRRREERRVEREAREERDRAQRAAREAAAAQAPSAEATPVAEDAVSPVVEPIPLVALDPAVEQPVLTVIEVRVNLEQPLRDTDVVAPSEAPPIAAAAAPVAEVAPAEPVPAPVVPEAVEPEEKS